MNELEGHKKWMTNTTPEMRKCLLAALIFLSLHNLLSSQTNQLLLFGFSWESLPPYNITPSGCQQPFYPQVTALFGAGVCAIKMKRVESWFYSIVNSFQHLKHLGPVSFAVSRCIRVGRERRLTASLSSERRLWPSTKALNPKGSGNLTPNADSVAHWLYDPEQITQPLWSLFSSSTQWGTLMLISQVYPEDWCLQKFAAHGGTQ